MSSTSAALKRNIFLIATAVASLTTFFSFDYLGQPVYLSAIMAVGIVVASFLIFIMPAHQQVAAQAKVEAELRKLALDVQELCNLSPRAMGPVAVCKSLGGIADLTLKLIDEARSAKVIVISAALRDHIPNFYSTLNLARTYMALRQKKSRTDEDHEKLQSIEEILPRVLTGMEKTVASMADGSLSSPDSMSIDQDLAILDARLNLETPIIQKKEKLHE